MATGKDDDRTVTERLLLRPMNTADADDVHEMLSCKSLMQWTPNLPHTSREQTRACVQWMVSNQPTVFYYSIVLRALERPDPTDKEQSRVISFIGTTKAPGFGQMLHLNYHGKGYGTESLRAFLPIYWARVPPAQAELSEGPVMEGFDFIEAQTDPVNMVSCKVKEKCGFRLWDWREKCYESAVLGNRDLIAYRLPRPGTALGKAPIDERCQLLDGGDRHDA